MEQKVVDILSALQTSVTDLAPEAWLALVIAARIDSILSLAYVVTMFSAAGVWGITFRRVIAWCEKQNDSEPPFVLFGIGSLVLFVLTAIAIAIVFSTSTWLGLFYPEAAVVRDLLKAATE